MVAKGPKRNSPKRGEGGKQMAKFSNWHQTRRGEWLLSVEVGEDDFYPFLIQKVGKNFPEPTEEAFQIFNKEQVGKLMSLAPPVPVTTS